MKKILLSLSVAIAVLTACTNSPTESIPLPEHPRPDFERATWQNLNGYWSFTFDEAVAQKALAEKNCALMDRRILVPFPWGSKLSEVPDSGDIAWYGRDIRIPRSWKGKRVFLVVGASDWDTQVWFDGQEIGRHQGGYTPFECELTEVRYGESQQLFMRVDDTSNDAHLYGKQGYGNARGIWQTVYLEARGENYISSLHFTPDIDASAVQVEVKLAAPASKGEALKIDFHTGGQPAFTADMAGRDQASFTIPLKDQHLWDLDDPFLYEVTARLGKEDAVRSYFGQRKVSTMPFPGADYNYIALNNKPLYLQLCLDQSYHPEGFYTFPSDEFMKNEILLSKRLGLNGNRIHIKVEVPRKLYWADRLGLLIMADTPNFWGQPTDEARTDWEHCLRNQVERDYNHPSIFAWVNFNETWGLKDKDGVYQPETQEWVRSMYHLTKSLDSSRLVEDMSVCLRDHVESDINSWHSYRPGYDWEKEIAMYVDSTYPGSTFNYIGGNRQNGAPMINSECGNVWGYKGSAGDCDYTWDYHIMIDAFRRQPKCAGWLYTEHHDVINEWNGYVHYDRSPKIDGLDELVPNMGITDFQSPYYISPERYLYTEPKGGETIFIPVYASFMTDKDPGQLTLETELVGWDRLGSFVRYSACATPIEFAPYLSRTADTLCVEIPKEEGLYLLRMVLKANADGSELHHNFLTFRVKEGSGEAYKTRFCSRFWNENLRPEALRTVTFSPANFTAQEWSLKQTSVLDGLKVNGFGSGYLEYRVELPEDIDPAAITSAALVFEASAKQLFGKDVGDDDIRGDYMLGGGTFDHCKSPNAYAMTDLDLWPSAVEVTVNGKSAGTQTLADDPADHRGILSWGSQPTDHTMSEAGSYGELVSMNIPVEAFAGSRTAIIRFTVPTADEAQGGLALYGKDFGRYPLDPTLVLKLK
ncbi:MAG: glycoside hydrolase family 2 [Bacteroidaceae bacterium]|nr:glycoside hydrolase family 2 [Bacteroidaceae bacterium]